MSSSNTTNTSMMLDDIDNDNNSLSSGSMDGSGLTGQHSSATDSEEDDFLGHDSEEEEDNSVVETTTITDANVPTRHNHVWCDECGESPIIGTRYKSTRQNNYDICQECLEENHSNDTAWFVGFEREVVDEEEATTNTIAEEAGRGLSFHSLQQFVSSEDLKDPNSNVDDVTLYLHSFQEDTGTIDSSTNALPSSLLQDVKSILTNHTRLKEMDVQVFGASSALTERIVALAQGLQANTSILSISWTLYWSPRKGLDKEATHALQELLRHNTTARFFFVRRESAGWEAQTMPHDNLEDALFEALLHTNIDTFRYNCHVPVSDVNKVKACQAMQDNAHIRRIKATFETPDYLLELLRQDKKHKWMQQWLRSNEEECWTVLQDAIGKMMTLCDHNNNSNNLPPIDPVFVIYHFLRHRPELVF